MEYDFPLCSRQIYSPDSVFCEHRTNPEFPYICSLATIRVSERSFKIQVLW